MIIQSRDLTKRVSIKRNNPVLRMAVLLLIFVSISEALWEKIIPFEADIAIGILILIGFAGNLSLKRQRWKRSVLEKPILILLLGMILNLTTMAFGGVDYFNETVNEFLRLAMIMGLSLIVVQLLSDIESIKEIFKFFTIATTAVGISALFCFLLGISSIQIGGVEFILFNPWGGIEARLGGSYQQPNTFATPLVLAIPLAVTFAISGSRIIDRCFWGIAIMICSASLLLSQSRSAILGCIVGIMIMSGILFRLKNIGAYIFILLLALLGVSSLLVWTGMMDPVFRRLSWDYYVYQQMTSIEPSRLEIWREGLKLAVHNPFGYGAGTKYLIGHSLGVGDKSAHNAFISSLVGIGILGFIGMVLLFVFPLKYLWKMFKKVSNDSIRMLSLGLITGLVGFWIHNLAHTIIHWLVVWIYFASVAALLRIGGYNQRLRV